MSHQWTPTESGLSRLIAARHTKDLFVAQCKDGATWSRDHHRVLDAWACRRSFAHPCCWGYEIKVSRSDFLRDTKWTGYLPLCNEFYFVAPQGVIDKNELPPEAGLLQATPGGGRLLCVKRSPHRQIEPPTGLLMYILLNRSEIVGSVFTGQQEADGAYWRAWVDGKRENRIVGRAVGKRLSKMVQERIKQVEKENAELLARCERLEPLIEGLKALGFNPLANDYTWRNSRMVMGAIEERIKRLMLGPAQDMEIAARHMRDQAQQLMNTCATIISQESNRDNSEQVVPGP